MTTNNATLNARLNAANRALAQRNNQIKALRANQPKLGFDTFDKCLLSATKLGLFAMFGLFVAAQAEKQFPGILNKILPPTPRPSKTPRPTP